MGGSFSMTEQHQFASVADLLRKDRSMAEMHLIKPAWSPQSVFGPKSAGRSKPN
jgi:hypothetical protein